MEPIQWQRDEEGVVACRNQEPLVRLFCPDNKEAAALLAPPSRHPTLSPPRETVHLSPYWLLEWCDYWFESADRKAVEVALGGVPVTDGPTGSLRRIRFENQVGRATLAVTVDDVRLPDLPVEVVSAKLLPRGVDESLLTDHPLYYANFLQSLWQGIVGYLASLPFAFTAATGFAVGELGRPPDDLFLLHFLKEENTRQRFAEALEAVRRNLHRRLRRRDDLVPLAQAREVTAATVAAILPNAHRLVEADPARVSVARRLRGPDGRSYAPLRVLQELPEETLDTPENRFVRWFLRDTAAQTAHLSELAACRKECRTVPERVRRGLRDLRETLEESLRWPLWDGVREMQTFPAGSPVLLRRDGYRDLLTLFRELHTARKPLFDELAAALPARDVATLYEIWSFFRLATDLTRCFGYRDQPMLMLRSAPDMGLGRHTAADLGDGWELVYNRSYRGGRDSYSLGLRPDYTLQRHGRSEVVLDAKFKFDEKALLLRDDALTDDRERDVKAVDLYKMHTYRDALGVRAAVVVYPGNVSRFYPVTGGGPIESSLEALVVSGFQGIGGIGLVPEEPRE